MRSPRGLMLSFYCALAATNSSLADTPISGVDVDPSLVTSGGMQYVSVVEHGGTGRDLQIVGAPAHPVWSSANLIQSCGNLPCTWAHPVLQPTVTMSQVRDDGYRLTYTYENTEGKKGSYRSLGNLSVSGLLMLDSSDDALLQVPIKWVRGVGQASTLGPYNNCGSSGYDYSAYSYPGDRYLPAAVYGPVQMGDSEYYVGVSLSYPALDYQHNVVVMQGSPLAETPPCSGTADRIWEVNFVLNPTNGNSGSIDPAYNPDGEIEHGETRVYNVDVRFLKVNPAVDEHPNTWLRTLLPYREYLRSTYGPVEYTRDPRPVNAVQIAGPSPLECTMTNTQGYRDPDVWDVCSSGSYDPVHVAGWTDWCQLFNDQQSCCGWKRFMLWYPSGRHCDWTGFDPSIAFRMTTRMDDDSMSVDPNPYYSLIQSTVSCLNTTFPSNGDMTLGFWWGNSDTIQTGWGSATFASHPLDYLDTSMGGDRDLAFAEVTGAEALNVTQVGMDSMDFPLWEAAPWLGILQGQYQGMTFITESRRCDLLHRIAPTYFAQPLRSTTDIDNALADFLLPGNESWTPVRSVENGAGSSYRTRVRSLAQHGWVVVAIDPDAAHCTGGANTYYESRDVATREGSIANAASSGVSPDGGVPANLRICRDSAYRSDFDCSGSVGSNDFFAYFAFYSNSDPLADYDQNMVVNINDYNAFMSDFLSGL